MNAVRRIVVERFATGKTTVVDALCSTDLAKHQCDRSGTDAQALEHVKDAIRQLHAVRPGMRFAIEDVLEDGDTIWARVRGPGAARAPSTPTARTAGGDHPGGHRRVTGVCPSGLPS